jgi:hypothetical protein
MTAMCRIWLACVVLSGCVRPMVRAPDQIPSDGVVECTDSMKTPIALAALGVASLAVPLYAAKYHTDGMLDSGGIIWGGALSIVGIDALFHAGEGAVHAHECRGAKERGAEVAAEYRRKADARAQAGIAWKRAAAAARADDCATVRELDPEIRELDVELHDVVFMRDVAIARCLVAAQ